MRDGTLDLLVGAWPQREGHAKEQCQAGGQAAKDPGQLCRPGPWFAVASKGSSKGQQQESQADA